MKRILSALLATSFLISEEKPYDANLFKQDKAAFSFHGSILFWRVQEGAVDYALKMRNPSRADHVYAQGDFKKATFDGEPGFRIAANYYRAPNYWEMWAQYTHLSASGSNSVSAGAKPDTYLNGTWPQIENPIQRATSSIRLKYNVFDWLVDRVFIPNPHLRLRLLGGATVPWMDQSWKVRYFDERSSVITQIRNQWDFVGGGIRFGTLLDWYMGCDLYLTGTTTLATVLGSYHNAAKQTDRSYSGLIRDARYHDIRPAFSVQALLGLSWQKSFCSTRMELFGGYELNTWFNLQEVYRSTSGSAADSKETWLSTSAIALQGLNLRATVSF